MLEEEYPKLIKNKNFLLLWQGQIISQLGDSLFYFAITIWMIPTFGLEAFALLMAITSIPKIFIGPIAGAIVDRVNRKTIIWLSDILRGILMFLATYIIITDTFVLGYLYIIFTLSGILSSFFNPAISATLPNLVHKEQLTQANSLRQGAQAITTILGPAIGGILLVILGSAENAVILLIVINGISYLLSGITELFIQVPKLVREKLANVGGIALIFLELKEGFIYVGKSHILLRMMIIFSIINFFLVPIFELIVPGFVITNLGQKQWVGFIESAVAVGLISSSIVLTFIKSKNHYRFIFLGLLSLGISTIILGGIMLFSSFSLVSTLYILLMILTLATLIGISSTIANIKLATVFQSIIPNEKRGRVFSFLNTLSSGLVPLALGLASVIISMDIPLFYLPFVSGIMVTLSAIIFSRIKGIKELKI